MHKKKYTLPEKLTEIAQQAPDKIVLQMKHEKGYDAYTYRDLYGKTLLIAKRLIKLGDIKKGDRVAIVLENRPEWVFIYFGILFAGAIAVPLDPQSLVDDLKYFFENSGSKLIFTSEKFQEKIEAASDKAKTSPYMILLSEGKSHAHSKRILPFSNFLRPLNLSLDTVNNIQPEDVASILYTSGTTGKPKGVMLTHQNFYSNFESIEQCGIFNRAHHILSILPLHHAFPFMVTLLVPIFSRNKVTYLARIDSDNMLTCMQDVGVTMLVGVPELFYIFYRTIVEQFKRIPFYARWPLLGIINLLHQWRRLTRINLNKYLLYKLHKPFGKRLIYFVCGGAKLDKAVEIFLNKVGFTLLQGYGLTETAPVVTLNPPKKPKVGSVGKVIPNVSINIVNANIHHIGEVAIKGPNVMKGYYGFKKETSEVLKDGWFYSSDLGYMNKKGYLYLTGRKNELIVLSNGKNISPEEVEAYYAKSQYIKELCVFPIEGNQKLVAVIRPDFDYFEKKGELNIDDVLKPNIALLSKTYPPYKCIMGFVISKDSLPRTRLGKLKRYEVRQQYLSVFEEPNSLRKSNGQMAETDKNITAMPIYNVVINEIKHKRPDLNQVELNDHLGLDLGFDSLARIELIAELGRQLSTQINESQLANVSTVKELVLAIDTLLPDSKRQSIAALKPPIKVESWKDILAQKPAKTITHKISLNPCWCSRVMTTCFFGSFYFLFKLFFHLKVTGLKNLPKDKPFILCPNHTSFLDGFFISAAMTKWLRVRMFFLADRMYFDVPVVRHLIKIGHIIAIDSATHLKEAMQACAYVLNHKRAICIFPEGRRSIDGDIQPFKKGVGILAKEFNVPLIPVYISGAFDILPIGKAFPRLHRASITIGKPVSIAQMRQNAKGITVEDDYDAIAKGIQKEVEKLSIRQ